MIATGPFRAGNHKRLSRKSSIDVLIIDALKFYQKNSQSYGFKSVDISDILIAKLHLELYKYARCKRRGISKNQLLEKIINHIDDVSHTAKIIYLASITTTTINAVKH